MSALLNRPGRPQDPHGVCRWLPDAPNGNHCLEINGCAYELEDVPGGTALCHFDRNGEVVRYVIDRTQRQWRCSCPDATYRRRECKHVLAIRAALAALPL